MKQTCKHIQIGDSHAIICGGEPDHICDDKGNLIYSFSDGYIGTLFDKAKLEKLNLNMCDDDKLYFLMQKDINVSSCSVSCSICGRAAIDNFMWI